MPICLGYLSVSFAFGIMATQGGLPVWVALLISMTNLTSAGQVAGTQLILAGGTYVEIAVTTFIINIRYMLMSLSLSQKVESRMTNLERWVLAFGITDEIFAVAIQQKEEVNAKYLSGLVITPYVGWALGTLLGATATGLLPDSLRNALGIAIYGMFIAIIIPPACKAKPIAMVVLLATVLSCCFKWLPILNQISSGWVIIICAVVVSAYAAARYPIDDEPARKGRWDGMTFDLQRVLLSVAIMAVVTYIIRVLPLAIFKKKIQNRFIRSFLAYVPYAVLAAMTFPAILFSTAEAVTVQSVVSAAAGLLVALVLAYKDKGLLTVAVGATAAAFLVEQITRIFSV